MLASRNVLYRYGWMVVTFLLCLSIVSSATETSSSNSSTARSALDTKPSSISTPSIYCADNDNSTCNSTAITRPKEDFLFDVILPVSLVALGVLVLLIFTRRHQWCHCCYKKKGPTRVVIRNTEERRRLSEHLLEHMNAHSDQDTVHTCTTYLRTTNLGPSGGNPSVFELFTIDQNSNAEPARAAVDVREDSDADEIVQVNTQT